MSKSPAAEFLAEAILISDKTQKEIAEDAGFTAVNMLTMMKQGHSKIPIERIPALALALEVSAEQFLEIAMKEYHPETWEVIQRTYRPSLNENQRRLLEIMYQVETYDGPIIWDYKLEDSLRAMMVLSTFRVG
ncbi:helix-turn-helix domain-containing protein [Anianabacter salinae]|uniref:helix-turn-helix domain-containing protein n=1 Tax=Anianabacter salinae TaxID=2851023 RepID=UPI00225E248F|nr:helix-turn-helix transcriptional regulator [Anianabacter salinae]MBV0912505.1 helix-turn-helix domain-containing protein [Anianabacter salinae]